MKMFDLERLLSLVPFVGKYIRESPLPGCYLWEYIGVALRRGVCLTTTVYTHEPEWLAPIESKIQRGQMLSMLEDVLGPKFPEEVFVPDGKLVRIDPSFKSSDNDSILRLEVLFNSDDAKRQRRYMNSVIMAVCGRCGMDLVNDLPTISPYHCAVEVSMCERCLKAARLYFRDPQHPDVAFIGYNIDKSGRFTDRKVYRLARKTDVRGQTMFTKDDLEIRYVATTDNDPDVEKVYFFNWKWRMGEHA